jgi:hypothetical protein
MHLYWCPRCRAQSQRPVHFCEKGPPLFPQLDTETLCEVFPLRWEDGIAEDGTRTRRLVSDWAPDPERPGNVFEERAAARREET